MPPPLTPEQIRAAEAAGVHDKSVPLRTVAVQARLSLGIVCAIRNGKHRSQRRKGAR